MNLITISNILLYIGFTKLYNIRMSGLNSLEQICQLKWWQGGIKALSISR